VLLINLTQFLDIYLHAFYGWFICLDYTFQYYLNPETLQNCPAMSHMHNTVFCGFQKLLNVWVLDIYGYWRDTNYHDSQFKWGKSILFQSWLCTNHSCVTAIMTPLLCLQLPVSNEWYVIFDLINLNFGSYTTID
jgi:hypothetical protein